jgi:nitroimidazol reductase NimA-like FMN-containing flavoprotein (pyridoxamine 5'-phosphate oxidase superfamily)
MREPRDLSYQECRDLLAGGVVGRAALCTPTGPQIIPVNYVMYDDSIVFRTNPYSVLGTYGWNTDLAFEVDSIDPEHREGWSVVVVGRAEMIEDPEQLRDIKFGSDPKPWAGGSRWFYVRLRWRKISGRRVGDGNPSRATEKAAR